MTISADLMKKCLESSKFAGLTWELILETYFGEPLQVKKGNRTGRVEKARRLFCGDTGKYFG
ncbi:MAG: TIGR02679 domain-containing protein [[Ruminococcus] torques]